MNEQAKLYEKMRALASSGHPRAAELIEKAADLEAGVNGYFGDVPPTINAPSFLGRYARARILWCECSGEPLV